MQRLYSLSNYPPEAVSLVKIWGNWCGPNWTGGEVVSAENYKGSWSTTAIDDLDRACRAHDKVCSTGCTAASDRALVKVARRISTSPIQRIFRPAKARAADRIIAAISLAAAKRRR